LNQSELPTLTTKRLFLHVPSAADAVQYGEYYACNSEHLRPWEPMHAPNINTAEFWERLLPVYRDEYLAGAGLRFAMRLREDPTGELIGLCHIMQIQRGASQSCVIGYSIDIEQQGNGYMTEALLATIKHAFDVMQLHRLQATYMPMNIRSARILRKLGFQVEGYLRDFLFIDGAWRDHISVALVNPNHANVSDMRSSILASR
jgi:ribosomal-protein-alanine N-acetyltransferase